jgi:tRNA threonylcarbamoyladenosine modification (KEOPS) complex  Pcc1 subunit
VSPADGWSARVLVVRPGPESAGRLEAALAPELSREVPRTRVRLLRPEPNAVELEIRARDTGAVRAGLNTLLGWIALCERVEDGLRSRP